MERSLLIIKNGRNGFVAPTIPVGFRSAWTQYTIQIPLKIGRDIIQEMLGAHGAPSMIYYPKPMHKQMAFENAHIAVDERGASCRLCETVLSLPMGPYIELDAVSKVVDLIAEFVEAPNTNDRRPYLADGVLFTV